MSGCKKGKGGKGKGGKSTLMKIIAGLEQPTQGEVVWSPGYTVGYLPQDPPLDEAKTVKENVQEGCQQVYDALKEYDDINVKFGLEYFIIVPPYDSNYVRIDANGTYYDFYRSNNYAYLKYIKCIFDKVNNKWYIFEKY